MDGSGQSCSLSRTANAFRKGISFSQMRIHRNLAMGTLMFSCSLFPLYWSQHTEIKPWRILNRNLSTTKGMPGFFKTWEILPVPVTVPIQLHLGSQRGPCKYFEPTGEGAIESHIWDVSVSLRGVFKGGMPCCSLYPGRAWRRELNCCSGSWPGPSARGR